MKRFRVFLACTAAGVMLSACTQGATGPPGITSSNPLANSKLQMAVGTANIQGAGPFLNVISTMRQPSGDSAVLADTPKLTGPFTLPAAVPCCGLPYDGYSTLYAGPSAQEVAAGGTIEGTPQSIVAGTPLCDSNVNCGNIPPNSDTFGLSGGDFGLGFAPYNSTINGTATFYEPYVEPLYDTLGGTFLPWGGPPAFDPLGDGMGWRDGQFNICEGGGCGLGQILGIAEGITVFENVTPALGSYNLTVTIPTSPTSSGSVSTTASLTSAAMLGTAAAPTIGAFDGSGGVALTVAFPAGVTEGYIEVIDFGPTVNPNNQTCQGVTGTSFAPVYYTIHVTAGGTFNLPDTDGPNFVPYGQSKPTGASPSICTVAQNTPFGAGGDQIVAYFIGMDYPLYAASYTGSKQTQTPTIAGAGGQADITISAPSPPTTSTSRTRFGHGTVQPHLTLKELYARYARTHPHYHSLGSARK